MSGLTPPKPIADFADHHYIRGEDIIRPKPRRLVDMRRSALGPGFSISPPGSSLKADGVGTFGPGVMSSTGPNTFIDQLPPILPAKPYESAGDKHAYLLRPNGSGPVHTKAVAEQNARSQTGSPQYLPMGQPQYANNNSTTSPQKLSLKGFPLNQRSVPNLPHLLQPFSSNNMYTPTPTPGHQQPARPFSAVSSQVGRNSSSPQKRLFLSPQPTDSRTPPSAHNFGSSGNLLNEEEEEDANAAYYSELTLPQSKPSTAFVPNYHHQNSTGFGKVDNPPQLPKPPRLKVEWKSVDNLQKHNGPRFTAISTDIDISSPTQNSYQSPPGQSHPLSKNVKPFKFNRSPMANASGEKPFAIESERKTAAPEKSPEYDRIKSPGEIAQELKERFQKNLDAQYVEPDPPKGSINGNNNVVVANNTINFMLNQISQQHGERLESSEKQSTSEDMELGTPEGPLSPTEFDMYTTNAGSTPSAKSKSRTSGVPPSKFKSRRKNILHNLTSEEMCMLSCNPNSEKLGANNTGTGGSSDGSSGHASMSESQASGSPPAEYASISDCGPYSSPLASAANNVTNVISAYKSVLKSVPEDETLLNKSGGGSSSYDRKNLDASISSSGKKGNNRSRNRNKEPLLLGSGNNGLEDIKQAIEQLTLRSHHGGNHSVRETGHHSSYSTSTYSSMSGSECERHRRPSHLIRYSSLDTVDTVNTQVTSADEFVWVDSHSRLVELQHIPWSNHDILKVIEKSSKLKDNLERISMETVPRVSFLLQRALVRIARETQRLSKAYGFCSKQEISSALRIVLSPALADSCSKACLRAAAMFSVSTSDPLHRESKSSRAGLNLHVGRFHRWMIDVRLGRFVHEFASVYLTASLENLIEEILGQALSYISNMDEPSLNKAGSPILTSALLDQGISNNGDLWGLLQAFAHLNAGRTASGALALPRRWASVASVDSSGSSSSTIGPSLEDSSLSSRSHSHSKSIEQSLLTTCVGSIGELSDILSLVSKVHYKQLPLSTTNNGSKAVAPAWSPSAVHTLFYFMRCSQLENTEDRGSSCNLGSSNVTLGTESVEKSSHGRSGRVPVQELVYERPFIVLPPIIEWVRVAAAHADHRHSSIVDKDDVMQAARLLLPGIDCPVRFIGSDEFSWPRRSLDEFECNRRLKIDLAFKMLTSGRSDLVAQALLLMPPSKANTFNEAGLSPLIMASIRGEETMVKVLLEAGAETDAETPTNNPNFPQANSETQHWTALTFAALMNYTSIVKVLLEKNANVEGGAKLSEEKSTQSPLQVAAAAGNMEIVATLLRYGANPFMSTLVRDSLCYTGSAQRGSFSAISVAASHGQRTVLHKLLSHPFSQPSSKEVLSLEEILAEGAQPPGVRSPRDFGNPNSSQEEPQILSKSQVKVLQEAMYQSAENGHLEITLDLRNLGVPWTLHCWINSLATSYELRCETVIDQLLQDFLQILQNEDFSQSSFVDDCVPLLFTIFRNSKNEGTTLLLADIFQTCYGMEPIKEIRDTSISNGTRIDPKYVNNPELSDVQFRVEGRVFYAHKIVLVTSSQRFKSMLKGAPDTNPPVLQINDVRYPIFEMVMEYLYNGSSECIRNIEADDVLELMAAANFFQLDGLLRFCESRCSQKITPESLVSMYIHAKVYNAVQLLEYCQGFLLQNMVSLMTFDDSVRRLIFGKKLHNHDVLAGLLLTLQTRLKSRPTNTTRKSK